MAVIAAYFKAYQGLMICLGVPGNVLILVCYGRKSKKLGTDVLIMGLACLDLFASLFNLTRLSRTSQRDAYCQFVFFGRAGISFAQVAMTFLISIDRYMAVCKPFNRRISICQAVLGVVISTSVALVSAIPFISLSHYDEKSSECIFIQTISYWQVFYAKNAAAVWFVPCITLSAILYGRTIFVLRRQSRVRAALTGPSSWGGTLASQGKEATVAMASVPFENLLRGGKSESAARKSGENGQQSDNSMQLENGSSKTAPQQPTVNEATRSSRSPINQDDAGITVTVEDTNVSKRPVDKAVASTGGQTSGNDAGHSSENRVTLMLGITTVVFFLSYLPPITMGLMPAPAIQRALARSDAVHTTINILYRLYEINSVVNVFLYWGLNRRFRNGCREVFIKIKGTMRFRKDE